MRERGACGAALGGSLRALAWVGAGSGRGRAHAPWRPATSSLQARRESEAKHVANTLVPSP